MKWKLRYLLSGLLVLCSISGCSGSSSGSSGDDSTDISTADSIEVDTDANEDVGTEDAADDTGGEDTNEPDLNEDAVPDDGGELRDRGDLPERDAVPDRDVGGDSEVDVSEAGAVDFLLAVEELDDPILVRAFYPSERGARYSTGAPVLVDLPGGWGAGDLTPPVAERTVTDHGYVAVEVLLPGGQDRSSGISSGGDFDYRGAGSMAAIREAILFAGGVKRDSEGVLLTDVIPFASTDELGVVGRSNGGNLALVALAESSQARELVDWVVTWESPLGDQYANVEIDVNPYHELGSCTATSCPLGRLGEFLRFDPDLTTESRELFSQSYEGGFFVDTNENGVHNGREATFSAFPAGETVRGVKLFMSAELRALVDAEQDSIFPDGDRPSWLASAAEGDDFWDLHDGALRVREIADARPDLYVLHVQTATDHVQASPDYPHAMSHMLAWLDAGHVRVRLNPDASYMADVTGMGEGSFPDNDGGQGVQWPGAEDQMEPERVRETRIDPHAATAGIVECADRNHYGNWDANLDDVLSGD